MALAFLEGCAGRADARTCEEAASKVAELRIAVERVPPRGRVSVAPFNTPEREAELRQEAHEEVFARCQKGWSMGRARCVSALPTLDEAARCNGR